MGSAKISDQMPLQLPHEAAMGREDFLRGPSNRAAFDMIDLWPNWPASWLLLAGPVGAGKSHLANIWQERSNAMIVNVADLNDADPTELVQSGAIVVEDADSPERDDTALFHLLNAAREARAYVLITARNWPESWGVGLPDLMSRLRLTTPVEIYEPDDELLRSVLVKLFADRQLSPDPSVIEYILMRMERSIGAALVIVEAIDQQALAQHRTITRPFVSLILKELSDKADGLVP
ncbi:hypothetical protein SAMN04488056_104214 [Cohaesibacter marisflavi]|uniref:Hda lid domain-containing protein n=1 Tax=Cohaesibacter marisflavi TaxID=655353 RepID=A0A1I5FUZ2_9HYPH|nr:hypothetical protein [Cohaesibacter marisflavi]SFO27383.1 hypothetical protein SAMN04488056_104214 [Cohaesibacter marisflavi]